MVSNKTVTVVFVVAKVAGALRLNQFAGNGGLTALLHRSVPYSLLIATTHTGIIARLKASKMGCMSCVVGLDPSVKNVMNSELLQPGSGVYNDRGSRFKMRTASEEAKTCSTPHSMNLGFHSKRTWRMVSPSKSSGGFSSGSSPEMKIKVGTTLVL